MPVRGPGGGRPEPMRTDRGRIDRRRAAGRDGGGCASRCPLRARLRRTLRARFQDRRPVLPARLAPPVAPARAREGVRAGPREAALHAPSAHHAFTPRRRLLVGVRSPEKPGPCPSAAGPSPPSADSETNVFRKRERRVDFPRVVAAASRPLPNGALHLSWTSARYRASGGKDAPEPARDRTFSTIRAFGDGWIAKP